MKNCPKCGSDDVHRSRARSRWEAWRKAITPKRPFRCHACGWRGWSGEIDPHFTAEELNIATRAMLPDPPGLTAAGLTRGEPLEINLATLDSLDPGNDVGGPPAARRRPD